MPAWIYVVEWLTRLILLLLLGLSVWSVAIMVDRRKFYREVDEEGELSEERKLILEGKVDELKSRVDGAKGIRAGTLQAALTAGADSEKIDRAVSSYLADQRPALERGFIVLATLGSNAPFVGLFGTVLGIIQAFGALATSVTGTGSVMSAISEALVVTAAGLFVAIPAVVAFNYFNQKMDDVMAECESLRDLLISRMG